MFSVWFRTMSGTMIHQNNRLPQAMYLNQHPGNHMTSPAHSLPLCSSYSYLQQLTFNHIIPIGIYDYPNCKTTNDQNAVGFSHVNNSLTTKEPAACKVENKVEHNLSETGSDGVQNYIVETSQSTRLCLPNIKASDNFAENVMSEETDLGYYSFCDISDIKVGDMSEAVDGTQENLSTIIEDVLDSLDEQMFSSNNEHRQFEDATAESRHSNCTQTTLIPCAFQNIIFNFQSASPNMPQTCWSQDIEQSQFTSYASSKSFSNNQELAGHLSFHNDKRPHKCPYCKKSFTQKSTLRTHIRTHTGEKPYCCKYCVRSFGDYSTYRKHLRIHTGEKPYVCDVCKKSFTQSGNMIRHRDTHFRKRTETK